MRFFAVTTFRNALLIAMLVAALIPSFLISVPLVFRIYSLAKENAERELTFKADQIASAIEHELILLANRAVDLSHDSEVVNVVTGNGKLTALAPFIEHFLEQNTVVSAVFLLGKNGTRRLAFPAETKSTVISPAAQNWLGRADLSGGKINRASYQLLQIQNPDTILVMFLPVAREARGAESVLAVIIPLENIARCHLYQVKPHGNFTILQNGVSLFGSAKSPVADTIAKEVPLIFTHGGEGKNLVFSFRVSEPRSLWFGMVRRTVLHLIAFLLVVFGLLTLVAIKFSRLLTEPIASLTRQVIAYSLGKYQSGPVRVPSSFKELEVFSQTLEQMAKKILVQLEHATLLERWKGDVERSQIQSALNNLREQMRPHFLFNTLNNIATMVSFEPDQATRMLTKLSDLYRLILDSSQNTTSLLALEMQIVENYLELQKMRFENRLAYSLEVSPRALSQHAPSLLLQTLVENAVKHGVSKSRFGGEVHLSIQPEDGGYLVQIRNSGARLTADEGTGTGLKNTRQRLDLLYGNCHGFTICSEASGHTLVKFKMSGEKI